MLEEIGAGLLSQNDQEHGGFAQRAEAFEIRFGGIEDHAQLSSSRIQLLSTWAETSGSCEIFSRRCLAIISAVLVITGVSFKELSALASASCSSASSWARRVSISLVATPEPAGISGGPVHSAGAGRRLRITQISPNSRMAMAAPTPKRVFGSN